MKVVVVGASSGLGRCIAAGLGERGAQVALMARRKERLADAAAEAGPGCAGHPMRRHRRGIVPRGDRGGRPSGLGGIDALVYATGIGPLVRLADLDAGAWRRVFDTNVIGAALDHRRRPSPT